jgi:uncharacterized protein
VRAGPDTEDVPLDAGPAGAWLAATDAVATGAADADVACDDCTACCRSGWFVHVAPDEPEALRRIPPALQFPAPGRPAGHVVVPHDEHGRCPMLTDDGCSIYDHRPRTCRAFDCRVYAAAGLRPDGRQEVDVARRADRWRFDTSAPGDADQMTAVRRASSFLQAHAGHVPRLPTRPSDVASAAVRVRHLFAGDGEPSATEVSVTLHR